MLIATLVVLNIPVYIFIGWLAFDTKQGAADTFGGAIVAILKTIFIPRIVRVMMGDDDDEGTLGIAAMAGFFIACGFIVYGEYYLITKYYL